MKSNFSHKDFRYSLLCIFLFAVINVVYTTASHASVSYTYDVNYRVTTALYNNSVCIAYSYDDNGNRTKQTNTVGGGAIVPKWGSGTWGCFQWSQ